MVEFMSAGPFDGVLVDLRRRIGTAAASFRLRDERAGDVAAREDLLDASFGVGRFTKTCERLREGRFAASGLSLVATRGQELVGTLRFWHIEAGRCQALLLGPLAVAPSHRSAGLGRTLIEHGLGRARKLGHEAVLLVGDAPYYERFGFSRALTLGLTLPGPVDESRFLGLDLVPGALAGATGRVVGAGLMVGARLEGDYRLAA